MPSTAIPPEPPLCHYCRQNRAEIASSLYVNMHGDVVETPLQGTTHTKKWRHAIIRVPRCTTCCWHHENPTDTRSAERKNFGYGCVAGLPILVIGFSILMRTQLSSADTNGYMAGIFFLSLVVMIGVALYLEGNRLLETSLAKTADAVDESPAIAERLAKNWAFGSAPGKSDKFAPATSIQEVELEASEFTGCPNCGMPHWWSEGKCTFCDSPHEAHGAQVVDWPAMHELLLQLMRLNAAPLSQVVEALYGGRRASAVEILIQNNTAPDDARHIAAVWEATQQVA